MARLFELQRERAAARQADQERRPTDATAEVADSKHCGAGSATATVDPFGNVYPCVQCGGGWATCTSSPFRPSGGSRGNWPKCAGWRWTSNRQSARMARWVWLLSRFGGAGDRRPRGLYPAADGCWNCASRRLARFPPDRFPPDRRIRTIPGVITLKAFDSSVRCAASA